MAEDEVNPERAADNSANGECRSAASSLINEAAAEARRIDAEHRARLATRALVTEAARRATADRRAAEADERAAEAARRAAEIEAALATEAQGRDKAERRRAELEETLISETAEAARRTAELTITLAAEVAGRAAAERNAAELERNAAELERARATEASRRAEAERRAAAIENAVYWKVTLPLRRVTDAWPPSLRRLIRGGLKVAWWSITLQLFARLRTRRNRRNVAISDTSKPESRSAPAVSAELKAALPLATPTNASASDGEVSDGMSELPAGATAPAADRPAQQSPGPLLAPLFISAKPVTKQAPSLPPETVEAARRNDLLAQGKIKRALLRELGPEEGFRTYHETLRLLDTDHIDRRRLGNLRDFARQRASVFYEIAPGGEPFTIAAQRTIGEGDQSVIEGVSPPLFVACLSDARVRGRSAVIEADGMALLDRPAAELARPTDLIASDPAIFDAEDGRVWAIQPRAKVCSMEVDEAFTLLGASSYSFGHWMGEFLPRYVAASASGALPPVPMMIDAAADGLMPRTHRQALDLLLPPGTDLILVPPLATAHVRRLWCAASPMRIHAGSDVGARRRLDDLSVSPTQLAPVLREMASRVAPSLAPRSGPERIFLARRPYRDRKLVNRIVIEAVSEARGFHVLYPEDMPFLDQVHALRHAQFILVPNGAALFLALFAEPGARVCVLGHSHSPEEALLAALLAEIGIDCTVIAGRCVSGRESKLSMPDYEIEELGFARFLNRWLDGGEL